MDDYRATIKTKFFTGNPVFLQQKASCYGRLRNKKFTVQIKSVMRSCIVMLHMGQNWQSGLTQVLFFRAEWENDKCSVVLDLRAEKKFI